MLASWSKSGNFIFILFPIHVPASLEDVLQDATEEPIDFPSRW